MSVVKEYLEGCGLKSASDVLGAAEAIAKPRPASMVSKEKLKAAFKDMGKSAGIGLAGACLGAVFWKKHRVLGFFAAGAASSGAYEVYRGNKTRGVALLAGAGAGVYGARTWRKHPAWAYVLSAAGASTVAAYAAPRVLR